MINLKVTNLELTPEIEAYLNDKVSRLEKFINPADESVVADIELARTTKHHKHGNIFQAEMNLHIAGTFLRAECQETDIFAAIDLLKDEMEREITKFYSKKDTLFRRGGRLLKKLLRRE